MNALVGSLAPWALTGVVVVTAVGAILMCLLVLRYGLIALAEVDDAPPDDLSRRALAVRVGHAVAGACFAVAAMLAVVALVVHARTATPAIARDDDRQAERERALEQDRATVARLRDDLGSLEERLDKAEARAHAAESRAAAVESRALSVQSRVDGSEARLGNLETLLRRVETSARQAGADAGRALREIQQLEAGVKQLERTVVAAPSASPRPATSPARSPAAEPRPVPHLPSAGADASPRPELPARPAPDREIPDSSGPEPRSPKPPATKPEGRGPEPPHVRATPSTPAEPRTADPRGASSPSRPAEMKASPGAQRPAARNDDRQPPAATQPRGVAGPAPAPPDWQRQIADKFRSDWEEMRREMESTNAQLRNTWNRLREWLTP